MNKPSNYPFVEYDIAVASKEKDFNNKVLAGYNSFKVLKLKPIHCNAEISDSWGIGRHDDCVPAPTYQELIDWFRDIHQIHLDIYLSAPYILGVVISQTDARNLYINPELGSDYYIALKEAIEQAFKLI